MKTLSRTTVYTDDHVCHTCGRATRHVAQSDSEELGRQYVDIRRERCRNVHRVYIYVPTDGAKPADSVS